MLQLLAMHTEGQSDQEIHYQEHGRVRRNPYVPPISNGDRWGHTVKDIYKKSMVY